MSDEHAQEVSEVIAFFKRLPLPEMQCAEAEGSASRLVADLIREWRRVEQRDLPVAACTGLSRCDDNTLFNVVGHCFDILLKRIVPRNNLRRRRRKEKRERYRLQREAASAVALAAAFGGAAEKPAAASSETSAAP
jgi:hypothetical protein